MQNNTPYCYLIGWSNLNIWYYGVRYAKNCHPADLWKTYFTSSETVKQFRIEFGEPDIIEVRKQFENVDSAIKFEHKVLRRMRVVENIKWLNKTDGRAFCIEETRKTWTKKYGVDNPAKADIVKKRAKDTITKKKIENPDYINDINKKREHTCITKYGTKNPRSNITVDDKIRETNKSRYGRENLFSGKEGVDLVSAKINEKYGKPYIMQVDEFKNKMNNWAFGCDVCQDVCPWNRFSSPHHEPEFNNQTGLLNLSTNEWYELTEETFNTIFKHSAVKRTKYKGLKRNLEFIKLK
jgi:hypothetical protein